MKKSKRFILVGPVIGKNASVAMKRRLASLRVTGSDQVIAVDGGLSQVKILGLKPTLAMGDWDSLKAEPKSGTIPFITLPTAKDRSDLYFAAEYARDQGATELIALGVSGGRPDHHLAMLFDLAEIAASNLLQSVRVFGEEADFEFVTPQSPWTRKLSRGQTVSLFSIQSVASGVTVEGMKYSLKNAKLSPSSHGLSNEITQPSCRVIVKKGIVLIMILHGSELS